MISSDLISVLKKHLPMGTVRGNELLLTPDAAIRFIDDLTNLGIRIAGIEIWKFLDQEYNPEMALEIPGAGGLLDKYLDSEANAVEAGNEIKRFILTEMKNLIPEAGLVSLIFSEEGVYDYFQAQRSEQ